MSDSNRRSKVEGINHTTSNFPCHCLERVWKLDGYEPRRKALDLIYLNTYTGQIQRCSDYPLRCAVHLSFQLDRVTISSTSRSQSSFPLFFLVSQSSNPTMCCEPMMPTMTEGS